MTKLAVQLSYGTRVCDLTDGLLASEVASQFGITDPALYQEFAESDFDPACFRYIGCFTLAAGVVGFDLDKAKEIAASQARAASAPRQHELLKGFTPGALAAQMAISSSSRNKKLQDMITALNAETQAVLDQEAAIQAAATITELNSIMEAV